ncbi:MAG: hypothetical protein KDI35_09405, partial [Gammaproteobacteria bacterium]|nr:hypothetical protein [Gammaproteobacteria bacterium]
EVQRTTRRTRGYDKKSGATGTRGGVRATPISRSKKTVMVRAGSSANESGAKKSKAISKRRSKKDSYRR